MAKSWGESSARARVPRWFDFPILPRSFLSLSAPHLRKFYRDLTADCAPLPHDVVGLFSHTVNRVFVKHRLGSAARFLTVGALFFCCAAASAQTTGSISGTVKDATGSVIPDLAMIARNVDTGVQQNATSNGDGFYAFTTLPVGRYEIETFRPGFKPYKRAGLTIDVGTKLQIDITLELGEQADQITVSDTSIQVEAESTQMGDVVAGSVMTAVGLNGRSFTDLLPLHPRIVPMSPPTPDSVVMAGAPRSLTPSRGFNPRHQTSLRPPAAAHDSLPHCARAPK